MNRSLDVDLVLREFYADDGMTAPDHVLDVVEQRIDRQPQRHTWRLRGRPFMNIYAKVVAAAAAAILVAVAGYNLLLRQPSIGVPSNPPGTPTANPTSTVPTTQPEPTLANRLVGWWKTAPSTCADQNSALERAGYGATEFAVGGWDTATCMNMTHGSVHRINFTQAVVIPRPSGTSLSGTLTQYAQNVGSSASELGWLGYYVLIDDGTFMAGDGGLLPYLTYEFRIVGDELVIDMVDNQFPAVNEAALWGDILAQTVIYESLPFTRE